MANNAQPQGRVLPRVGEHPSSVRTVAGTLTHVDASDKMTTGPPTNMAFLDNYLFSLTSDSDLNTPEIDLKAFDFGKENAKSNLTVPGMGMSKKTTSPQPFSENTAFFDMSISSPPSFGDEDPASSTHKYRMHDSQYLENSMMPTEHIEEPIPKAPVPLLTNSQPLGFNFNNVSHRNNHVTQPIEIPFDIPNDIIYDSHLFPDADLGLNDLGFNDDDELISSLSLDMYLGPKSPKNDILSQAIAGAELPSSEQLNNLMEIPGMTPPTIAQQQRAQLKITPALGFQNLLEMPGMTPPTISQQRAQPITTPALIASPLLSHDSSQSESTPQAIVIPKVFLNTSEYQTITYQIQGFAPSPLLQVQNNASDSIKLMEVDNIPSNMIKNSLDSANLNLIPAPYTYSAPTIELPEESTTIELPEELESKPVNIIFDEAVPSTSTGKHIFDGAVPSTSTNKHIFDEAVPSKSTVKRRRTVQKPARYRESLVDYHCDESQPSTSGIGEKRLKLTDEQKYNRIRVMNNDASRRCRQKRKQSIANMEHEIGDLENQQEILKAKEAELTNIRDRMKAMYYEFIKRKMAPR